MRCELCRKEITDGDGPACNDCTDSVGTAVAAVAILGVAGAVVGLALAATALALLVKILLW